jgi:hypothetical protein
VVAAMLALIVPASGRAAWSATPGSTAITWTAAGVTVVAIVALSAGLMLLLAVLRWMAASRRHGDPADPPRVPVRIRLGFRTGIALLLFAALVIGGIVLAVGELGRHEARPATTRPMSSSPVPERAPATGPPTPGSRVAPAVLLAVGGALLAGLSLLAMHGLRPAGTAAGGGQRRARVEFSPAVAGDWPEDARLAVFAAYRRAERELSDAGVSRDAAEGPREYLARVVARPGPAAAPLRELTATYEKARFSPHPLGASERTRALRALRRLEAELGGPNGGDG